MPRKGVKEKTNVKTTEEPTNEENVSGSDHEDGDVTGQAEKGNSANADNMENPSNMEIIKAIRTFKQEFHDKMEGVLVAIKNVQKDVKECNGRITEAEQRISTA